MELVFLKAKQKLAKKISEEGVTPYPLIKNFTSVHKTIKKDPSKLLTELTKAAAAGMCLHKGPLKRELNHEPRALMTDRVASTELLVLDFDNIQVPLPKKPELNTQDLENLAEQLIQQMPQEFHDVTYIAQASASLGYKKILSYISFILKNSIHPKVLKETLKLLNYETTLRTFNYLQTVKLSYNLV